MAVAAIALGVGAIIRGVGAIGGAIEEGRAATVEGEAQRAAARTNIELIGTDLAQLEAQRKADVGDVRRQGNITLGQQSAVAGKVGLLGASSVELLAAETESFIREDISRINRGAGFEAKRLGIERGQQERLIEESAAAEAIRKNTAFFRGIAGIGGAVTGVGMGL